LGKLLKAGKILGLPDPKLIRIDQFLKEGTKKDPNQSKSFKPLLPEVRPWLGNLSV